jgi:hypothetical protein
VPDHPDRRRVSHRHTGFTRTLRVSRPTAQAGKRTRQEKLSNQHEASRASYDRVAVVVSAFAPASHLSHNRFIFNVYKPKHVDCSRRSRDNCHSGFDP